MGENLKALVCTSRHRLAVLAFLAAAKLQVWEPWQLHYARHQSLAFIWVAAPQDPHEAFCLPFISCNRACTLKGEVGRSHVRKFPTMADLRTPGCLSARNSSGRDSPRMIHPLQEQIPLAVPPSALRVFPCLRSIISPSRVLPRQPVPQALGPQQPARPPSPTQVFFRAPQGAPNVLVWF